MLLQPGSVNVRRLSVNTLSILLRPGSFDVRRLPVDIRGILRAASGAFPWPPSASWRRPRNFNMIKN